MPRAEPAIRSATPGDIDAIHDLVQRAYSVYIPRIGARPQPMDDDYALLVDAGEVWVADRDGGVAGVLVLITASDHVLVHNIAVSEAFRGRGLGSALLRFAERHARDQGLPEVRLFTNIMMTENLAYYPRRGYRRTREVEVDGFRRVYFSKRVVPGRVDQESSEPE
jgi:N-acetylglutamate synthase-like GNAT family acetyltransferase